MRQKRMQHKKINIDGENDNYRFHVSSYSGMVGDSLSYHNGMQFSTKDTDNDKNSENCAASYHGAWCYNSCHASSLNGEYLNTPA